MKKWEKFLFVVIGLFAITSVSAYQDDSCNTCTPCPEQPPCCKVPGAPTTSAYNHPANINVCGCWDAYVTGTFLWVLPSLEQLEFAQTTFGAPGTGISGVGKVHEFNFDWKPAFKVGIGFNFDHDNWDVYLQYVRINTSMSKTHNAGNNPGEILSTNVFAQTLYNLSSPDDNKYLELKRKWDLDFNIFDLEFGRPYYNGKYLQFRAHYGLKGGWINLTCNDKGILDVSPTRTYEASMNSRSWLIGPRAGIQTKWTFADGFRFFGNAAASLFYQKFHDLSYREPIYNITTEWFLASDLAVKQISASLDGLLGIGWGTYFDRNNWHYDLAIGYEAQLFFKQNQMSSLKEMLNILNKMWPQAKAGDFWFHGLNVTMQLDF